MDDRVLYKPDIVAMLKLGNTRALDRLIRSGDFPRGRRLHDRRVFWTQRDIDAFFQLAGRMKAGPLDEDDEAEENPAPVRKQKKTHAENSDGV